MTDQNKKAAIQTIKDILHVLHEKRYTDLPACVDEMGWYPEGNINGHYHLTAILDNNWNKPILKMKTRSTQKVADTIELWLFETLLNWENRISIHL